MKENWVQAWGQAHAALSFFYYPSCEKTYRMVLCTAVSGEKLRVRFSNVCGKGDVLVGAVTAAKSDSEGTFTEGGFCGVTVNGKGSFTVKKGECAISDPIDFHVDAGEYIAISIFVKSGSLTGGNLLSNVNLITAKGDRTEAEVLPNEPRTRDSVRALACKVLRMSFHKPIPLFESVELLNTQGASSIVVFGDSISQQGFWTNAFEKRIRDAFPGRYSLINKSIMGNRVLRDYSPRFICKGLFGISGLNRYTRDILAYDDVEYVVFALGVNDFLQYGSIVAAKSEKPDPDEFCRAVETITQAIQSQGIKVIMLTLLGFGAGADYTDEKEELRSYVNQWLRENRKLFDGFYDQEAVCRDPDRPHYTRLEYLGKDKLHPNEAGGRTIADSFDLEIFSK